MKEEDIVFAIKLRRKALRLSQSVIAERLHISIKAYQNIENGITRLDLGRLMQIAAIFDISLQDLLFPGKSQNLNQIESSGTEGDYYLKIIQEKENYICLLEERLSYYRAVIQENKFV